MANYTQGEWTMKLVRFDAYTIEHKNEHGTTDHIATVNDFNRKDREAEVLANANLFFASREMYEALAELTDIVQGLIEGDDMKLDSFTLQPAQRALSKANPTK